MSVIYPLAYSTASYPLTYWGWQQKETVALDLLAEGMLIDSGALFNLPTYQLPIGGLAGDPVPLGRALLIKPKDSPNNSIPTTATITMAEGEFTYVDVWQVYIKGRAWARFSSGAQVNWQNGVSHYWRFIRAQASLDDAQIICQMHGFAMYLGETTCLFSRYDESTESWITVGAIELSERRELEIYCFRAGDDVIAVLEGKGYVIQDVPEGVGGSFRCYGYEVAVECGPATFVTNRSHSTTFALASAGWAYWLADPTRLRYVGAIPSNTLALGYVNPNSLSLQTSDQYATPVLYSVILLAEGELTRNGTSAAIDAIEPEVELALDRSYIKFGSPVLRDAAAYSLTLEGGYVFEGICLDQPESKAQQNTIEQTIEADSPLLLMGLKTCVFLKASLAGMDVDDALRLLLRMGGINPEVLEYEGTTADELGSISDDLLYNLRADSDATLASAWNKLLDELDLRAWWTGTAVRVQPVDFTRKTHVLTSLGGPVETRSAGNPASLWLDEATGFVLRAHEVYTGELPFSVHSPASDWDRTTELKMLAEINFDVLPGDGLTYDSDDYTIEAVHIYAAQGIMEVTASA